MTESKKYLSLQEVAQRCIPSRPYEKTTSDNVHFLAHVFANGELEDVISIQHHFSKDDLIQALINAPPGIIDARSWAYWNLILRDLSPPPPMPTRTFPEETKI